MRTRSPILIALIHPLNLLTLGVAVFAGLVSAWWLFFVGVLFWLIMVIAVTRDPSLRISHEMQRRAPLAQRFQRYFDRVERSQVSVFNSLASAPSQIRRVLRPVQSEIGTLTNQVHSLCQRMTVLENYRLVSQSRADLEADLQQIDAKIAGAEDVLVKREYEESRRSLDDRLSKLEAVSTQLDRVEAQLLSLTNEMDSTVTEIVRLQAIGPQNASRYVPDVVRRLREQSTQLKAFEREAITI
jgi:chromosome segregation ATPase